MPKKNTLAVNQLARRQLYFERLTQTNRCGTFVRSLTACLSGGRRFKSARQRLLLAGLVLILPGLAGCQRPAPPPGKAIQPDTTTAPTPRPPKSYVERTDDRYILIKDRLQLLKDQAAPLTGRQLHWASARIHAIETQVDAAGQVIGNMKKQGQQPLQPTQRVAIDHMLSQIENDIDATSEDIAVAQGRMAPKKR